jgi:ubiquinol-cytochrome c reductase cytochrome c1 subunit
MLKFARTLLLGAGLCAAAAAPTLAAEGTAPPLKSVDWSFQGVFGHYDRAQLRRGLDVYLGVCSACHSLRHLSYRNLAQIGVSTARIKALAAEKTKKVIDDSGDVVDKPRTPADAFASPFPNEQAAKAANSGAVPPDLSLIVKARKGGARYVYSLLTSFVSAAECAKRYTNFSGQPLKPTPTQHCNEYFPGHILAMAPPLTSAGQVDYTDKGSPKATVKQMAQDVAAFLTWAAEPKMEERKRLGIKVILFLLLFTGLMYGIYRKVWAGIEH